MKRESSGLRYRFDSVAGQEPLEGQCFDSARAGVETPLVIDLFCGLGGWTDGFLAEGWRAIGFDIERHEYGDHRYPAQLVIQDVLTLHGSQFREAALIVASPPCQAYSYRAMPWKRAKALPPPDNTLFEACFRIQREACEAAGRHIPLIVENVRGAQKWVGRARWNFGSFCLWGDVPALMPPTAKAVKVPGLNWSRYGQPGYKGEAFNTHADRRLREEIKNGGGSWFKIAHNTTSGKGQNPDGRKTKGHPNIRNGYPHTKHLTNPDEGVKQRGSGREWWDEALDERRKEATAIKLRDQDGYDRSHPNAFGWKIPRTGSKSTSRKFASAMIAKIPLQLSRHIARAFSCNGL
jgi:C-5 cytosine-specific DNA methylase